MGSTAPHMRLASAMLPISVVHIADELSQKLPRIVYADQTKTHRR